MSFPESDDDDRVTSDDLEICDVDKLGTPVSTLPEIRRPARGFKKRVRCPAAVPK